MTTDTAVDPTTSAVATGWYGLTAEDVARKLDVDPAQGLSTARAAELLERNGPNALPAEATTPVWQQFLAQYRSYMQIILVAAAIFSLVSMNVSLVLLSVRIVSFVAPEPNTTAGPTVWTMSVLYPAGRMTGPAPDWTKTPR